MVVGLDGSPGAAAAVAWAAAHTDRFGPVQPVAAWHYPWWAVAPFSPGSLLPPPASTFHEDVERAAGRMLDRIDRADYLDVLTVHGAAGPALVDAAVGATLLVVGTRGHGAVADGLLGSVSMHCVHRATCPVAIVPRSSDRRTTFDRVVVGIDPLRARSTLDWALANTPESTEIEVIHAWDLHETTVAQVASMAEEQLRAQATELVEETISAFDLPTRRITGRACSGDARDVLHAASKGADMLVLGARDQSGSHRGHFGGSVTNALTHQPLTTTVIVR